jgi:tRNA(fMet)-specific endonuclease VapC
MILDTNALSAIANGDPAAGTVFGKAGLIAIPVIVLGEYRFGIEQSRHRHDYEKWLSTNLPSCLVLDVTEQTTVAYAAIRSELRTARTPIPSNDVWIAALSRQHSLPLLSRDEHFDKVRDLRRLDW